jgi:CHAD domain-containing protein
MQGAIARAPEIPRRILFLAPYYCAGKLKVESKVMREKCRLAYCALCADAIANRIRSVRRLMEKVRRSDNLKAVHDLRVASRRLRSAIGLLSPCLPKKSRQWRKEVRKITRALGQARDLDVQIAFVKSFAAKSNNAAWRPGLKRLLKHLRRRRESAQSKLMHSLDEFNKTRVLRNMERILAGHARNGWQNGPVEEQALRLAELKISPLLANLLSLGSDLRQSGAVERHHKMRIAAKRLRYSLEVFEGLYGRAVRPALTLAQKMQTLLGDLHDCDVWIELLPNLLAARKERAAGDSRDDKSIECLRPGIEALRRDRVRQRRILYRQSLKVWQQSEKKKIWRELRKVIDSACSGKRRRRCRP